MCSYPKGRGLGNETLSANSGKDVVKMSGFATTIVLDLEFTGTPKKTAENGLSQEIIEIGAVKIGPAGEVQDSFQSFVRPKFATDVSMPVRKLTGIRRRDYLSSGKLEKVLEQFSEWAGSSNVRIVAWSGCDERQVKAECAFKDIELPPSMKTWVDAQKLYAEMVLEQPNKMPRLADAAKWLGVEVDCGKTHRAAYDAQVTAQVMYQLETGEYKKQRAAVQAVVRKPSERRDLSASIGSLCGELLQLRNALAASA